MSYHRAFIDRGVCVGCEPEDDIADTMLYVRYEHEGTKMYLTPDQADFVVRKLNDLMNEEEASDG